LAAYRTLAPNYARKASPVFTVAPRFALYAVTYKRQPLYHRAAHLFELQRKRGIIANALL
jgi:hypothetical protein